jgi:hypothetical protein
VSSVANEHGSSSEALIRAALKRMIQ